MSMKTILVPVEESAVLQSILQTALLVARRFSSYIEGKRIRQSSPILLAGAADGFGDSAGMVEQFDQQEVERTQRAQQLFLDFMDRNGVASIDDIQVTKQPVARWRDEDLPTGIGVGELARKFNLTVVGRPVSGAGVPSTSILEAAIFESGRPVLVAPPTSPSVVGEYIVIAWNGSMESARTIAFAMPFLIQAKSVVVLTIEHNGVPGPSAADVTQHLVANGIAAEQLDRPLNNRTYGTAMLEETMSLEPDLLIKGAFTHSRLHQMIFGGVTQHILHNAEIPVLMAH